MGRDVRPRVHNVNTQSDVIEFMLARVWEITENSNMNYHFIDIGSGGGRVVNAAQGFKSTKGYEIDQGNDFFDATINRSPTIYYMFNPFSQSETARLNEHLAVANGYLVYYDSQWHDELDPVIFKEVYSRNIVGGTFKVYLL